MVLGSGLSFQSCTSVSFAPVRAAESTLEPRRPGCIGGRLRPLLISEIRIRGLGLRIHDLRHMAVALWIAAGAGPKEVATRAGHTSVSFTLDRYGHLYPEADTALRDRLDALYVAGRPAELGQVVELRRDRSRPSAAPQRDERRR